MLQRMRFLVRTAVLGLAAVLLVSCRTGTGKPAADRLEPRVVHQISGAALSNLSYILTDPLVRSRLVENDQNFSIKLRNGNGILLPGDNNFENVTLMADRTVYGDVTEDGQEDAVTMLKISGATGEPVLEIAVVSDAGGKAVQVGSFSLGRAELNRLWVSDGKIHVNFFQRLKGDPGPRNTEITLAIAKTGSGELKHERKP
jgi:hypothetical protein